MLEFGTFTDQAAAWKLLNDHRVGIELLRLALQRKDSRWLPVIEALRATLPQLDGDDNEALAKLMAANPNHRHWSVVTNSLPSALTLAANPYMELQLLGGSVRAITQAVVGDQALRTLALMRADVAFIGSNAVTIDHGLSTADPQEAAVKRAMIANARQVVVLCDSTKLGRDYLVSFASLEDIDVVITDDSAPRAFIDELGENGVEVIIAR